MVGRHCQNGAALYFSMPDFLDSGKLRLLPEEEPKYRDSPMFHHRLEFPRRPLVLVGSSVGELTMWSLE